MDRMDAHRPPVPALASAPAAAGAGAAGVATAPGPLSATSVTARVAVIDRSRWTRLLGGVFLLGIVATTALIVVYAGTVKTPVVPPGPHIATYLQGVAIELSFHTFLAFMIAFVVCFGGALACARHLPRRWVWITIVLAHVIVFLGPVLLSQDIYSYIAYARLGVLHSINPAIHGPAAFKLDPVYRYVGVQWKHVASAYGPLFNLISYPLAPLGVKGAIYGFKVIATLASLATVALVWLSARRYGRDPLVPTMVVGLNPLLIVYGVGGAHNDLLMIALMMLGVWLALGGRDGLGAASIVAGAAIKVTSVAVLPFMLLSRRRPGIIGGTIAAGIVLGVISLLVFGVHSLDLVANLRRQQSYVSTDSFATEVAHLFGKPGVFPVDRLFLRAGLIGMVAYLLFRVWRGYDWIAASAWTLLAIAVTTTWLLAWYTFWALPLAAVARDRRVLVATLAVQALFLAHQMSPIFSPL
jgi:Glycosyltransferase family 87